MICPYDMSGCPDDLCYGSGCMQMNGYPMLDVCFVCGGAIDEEGDLSTCTCDGDMDDHSDEDYYWDDDQPRTFAPEYNIRATEGPAMELRSALTRLHLAVEMLAMKRPEECKELMAAKQGILAAVRNQK